MKKERVAEWKYFGMALEKRDDCVLSSCVFQIPLEKCSQENGVNKVGDGGVIQSTRGVWYSPLWISQVSSQPQAIPRMVSILASALSPALCLPAWLYLRLRGPRGHRCQGVGTCGVLAAHVM